MEINKSQVLRICKKIKRDLINYSFLACGAHNKNYLIETKQDKLVLRIENNLQFKNLKKEYHFLKETNGKLGPKVFLFDNSHKIIPRDFIIEEFIEGKHPKKATDDFIVTMANWYKKLHKIKTQKIPSYAKDEKHYSFLKSMNHFCINSYKKNREILNPELREKLDRIFDESEEITKKYNKLFARQKYFPLIHADPTHGNIFYSPGKVRLIDWEFVQYELGEWDLSFFIRKYELNKEKEKLFLKTYGFPETKHYQKRIYLVELRLTLMIIKWLIERLNLSYQNKLDTNQFVSDKDEILESIHDEIPEIKRIFKVLNEG